MKKWFLGIIVFLIIGGGILFLILNKDVDVPKVKVENNVIYLNGNDVDYYEYCISSNENMDDCQKFKTTEKKVTIQDDGTWYLYFYAVKNDKRSSKSEVFKVYVDVTYPVIDDVDVKDGKVTIKASDSSKLTYYFKIDEKDEYKECSNTFEIDKKVKRIYIKVEDEVGNVTYKTVDVTKDKVEETSNSEEDTSDNKGTSDNNKGDSNGNNKVNNTGSNGSNGNTGNNGNGNKKPDILNPTINKPTVLPVEPDEPDEPDDPDVPVKPTEPDEPTDPDEPVEPSEPDEPVKPTEPDDPDVIKVSDTSFEGFEFPQMVPENKKVTYEPIIFQNEMMKKYGTLGAGSQWPVTLETSKSGNLMLYGVDVAGLYKSVDHGKTWTRANSGFKTRGVGMFAIDPHNEKRVLALGLNNSDKIGGIHLSEDGADNWRVTFNIGVNGERYLWDGLEFDSSTYDEERKMTTDVYFSTPYYRDADIRNTPNAQPARKNGLTEDKVGLYKSSDGGMSFQLMINDERLADGIVRITDSGNVYVGNQHGLFRINKETNTYYEYPGFRNNGFANYAYGVTGLDVVGDTLYVQTWDGIYTVTEDKIVKITGDNYDTRWPQFVTVSKSNPNHIIYSSRSSVTNYYVTITNVSLDGGKTWVQANCDQNSSFYKTNWFGREKVYVIDPSNDARVISFGSDYLIISDDYGKNFIQTNGISNMMQGGRFNFNYYSPDVRLHSAQDYTGVITLNNGLTYNNLTIAGKGNLYGGFAADKETYYGFASPVWGGGTLTVTHDGGNTWTDTGLKANYATRSTYYSSLQSLNNPDVLFAAEYRSVDRGYNFKKMDNCVGVFTYNLTGKHELYGANAKGNLVVSYDEGKTWKNITNDYLSGYKEIVSEEVFDMAYDHVNNDLYVLTHIVFGKEKYSNQELIKYDLDTDTKENISVPIDRETGWTVIKSIAIDPNATSVIYVGMAGGYFSTSTALLRSIDGGKTFNVLTTNSGKKNELATNQGGYEVQTLRVDPYTGIVYISEGCYGFEVINPPYDNSLLKHNKPQEHTIKYVYDSKVVIEVKVKNNEKHDYVYNEKGKKFVDWYLDEELTKPFSNGSYVYNSYVLYAKLVDSKKITLMVGDKEFKVIDNDKYDAGDESLIPQRDGYVFAGWYKDKSLKELADFTDDTKDRVYYAGWYKVIEDTFDVNGSDVVSGIDYYNHKVAAMTKINNSQASNDRSLYFKVDKNSYYYISFKMHNRFRIGFGTYEIWQYNPVKDYYVDERDINSAEAVDEYAIKVVDTKEYDKMMIYYYNYKGSKDFMSIKNTFKICKIESMKPVL